MRTAGAVAALVAAALATADPVVGQSSAEVRLAGGSWSLAVESHRGFAAVRWAELPAGLVRGASAEAGLAQGVLPGGAPVELRAGSPFARVGDRVVPSTNAPYLEGGELWAPLQMLERIERSEGSDDVPASDAPGARSSAARSPAPAPSRSAAPFRVMIDPGHGGHDPGTMNRRTGAREKDIVLRVGRYLKEELDRRGNVKAFLTRDDDRFIRLQERPHMAISRNANLFLSIHVNAEPGGGRKARGVETYFLSPARSEESKRVAARENSVVELEDGSAPAGVDRLELVLATMDQDSHVTESRRFAGYVQNRYRNALRAADRGVKPGPFWVLVGASTNMPAILTEIGFITNTEDERRLTSEQGQREIARALADTVEEYAREYERRTSSFARGGE